MGTTLDAVLEVFYPESEYCRAGWDDVAAWTFNKDRQLMIALSETSVVVPFETCLAPAALRELSPPLQDAVAADIYCLFQLATPAALRAALAYAPLRSVDAKELDDWEDWQSLPARALSAAVETLVALVGQERVRIIFYRCT